MAKQHSHFRWIVFVIVLVTYLVMSSQRTAPGLVVERIMLDFNVSATTIGLLTSVQFFVYAGLQIPMGLLADRFGPNFFLISGCTLTGIGTTIYSLSTHELVLFFARILTGIGDATIWVNLVLILGQWFTAKEFTRLIGVAAMMGNLGYLLATVPFSLLIGALGWRPAFFSSGMLLCLLGLILYFVLVRKSDQPLFRKKEMDREKMTRMLRRIFATRQAWALFLCHFGIVGTYVGFISSWGVPYGMNVYGLTRSGASQLIMIGLVGALIGGPLAGWISSRLGSIKRPYMIVHMLFVAAWSVFLFSGGTPPYYWLTVLFLLIGILYGANALTFAAVRQTFSVKEAGMVTGFANTGGFLSAILLPSIFGKILDQFHIAAEGYYYGFFIPVIFSVIGLIGVLAIRESLESGH